MRKHPGTVMHWLAVALVIAGLSACQKQETADSEKGPAEKAGKQLDQAAARAGEELNKAAQKAGEGLQAFGQKIQKEAEQAQGQEKKE